MNSSTIKWAVIGAGGLLLYKMIKNGQKYNFLNARARELKKGDGEVGDIDISLSEDKTPVITHGDFHGMSQEERTKRLESLGDTYAAKVQKIADNMNTNMKDIYNRIGIVLAALTKEGAAISEKGIDRYTAALADWTANYTKLCQAAFSEYAKMAGMNGDVTKCTITSIVKNVDEIAEKDKHAFASNTISSTDVDVLIASYGHRSESITKKEDIHVHRERKIVMIPYCENYDVDPDKVQVVLASRTLAYSQIMGQIQGWVKAAPDPANFIKYNGKENVVHDRDKDNTPPSGGKDAAPSKPAPEANKDAAV